MKKAQKAAKDERNWIPYLNYCLRYYMHINPDNLTDEEWAQAVAYLVKIRKEENGQR